MLNFVVVDYDDEIEIEMVTLVMLILNLILVARSLALLKIC